MQTVYNSSIYIYLFCRKNLTSMYAQIVEQWYHLNGEKVHWDQRREFHSLFVNSTLQKLFLLSIVVIINYYYYYY